MPYLHTNDDRHYALNPGQVVEVDRIRERLDAGKARLATPTELRPSGSDPTYDNMEMRFTLEARAQIVGIRWLGVIGSITRYRAVPGSFCERGDYA
jgi:hypothetical protein